MARLENGDKKYSSLINEIETGQIKIPQFQRQFVWDLALSAKFLDSIIKGYPIGTFIYWRTNERLRSVRNIGSINLPEPIDGEYVNYVLDGQQRITTFFAALKGQIIENGNGKHIDYSNMYINLDSREDEDIVIIDVAGKQEFSYIKLTKLMKGDSLEIFSSYDPSYHNKINRYKEILQSYDFKGINLRDAEIDVATEVFTRLNVGGKDLSIFEIMVAKTYDPDSDYDLYDKFHEFLSEIEHSKYETISSSNVLQLISLILVRDCKSKTILKLDKQEFINTWDIAINSIKSSIDFLKSYGIPASKLLPYNTLIVPLSYFFYKNRYNPTGNKLKYLEDFFWRVSIGFRYSSSVESKLVQDIDKIDSILNGVQPKYEWSVDFSTDFITKQGYFATGRSFIKAILCLYAMKVPKSFNNNLDVNIDNSSLKIATSKNYHHFFPKAYMRKNNPQIEDWKVNHIANITIVDDYLNKQEIKAKAPSIYMEKFRFENNQIKETMKTHLINDLDEFGIWNDDFSKFFESRIKSISDELKKRIIFQESDIILERYEDYGEEEVLIL